jgi:hypothetical protein
LSYEGIRRKADEFLRRYNPKGTIPVPIEEIIEFEFGINIIPMPDLHKLFEIDGFTSSDLLDITVDQYVYENRPGRYRFTLAHEIGHVVLHADIYRAKKFQRVSEWMKFVNLIPQETHRWLEYQAYSFGGLVLAPREPLKKFTKEAVDQIRKEGIDLKKNWDFAWEVTADVLAKRFEVSTEVIEKRLNSDNVRETFR